MIIKELIIKGFKSFGNNEQKIILNDKKGELILLVGSNASGKSSVISSFEYTLYGKCRGRTKKSSTLSTLPNRINKELLNKIKFISNGTEIEIQRGISPNILTLIENGIENKRAGKSNIDEKIQDYIGIDFDTFKSFISMSVNDFKNFISLSSEDKQILLDKLFNLEIINKLNDILKDLNKSNKNNLLLLDREITTIEESIFSIKRSIEKSNENEKIESINESEKIKEILESKKDEFLFLKDKIEKIKDKDKELKKLIDKEKEEFIRIVNELKNSQKEIDLYNSGKCFTCGTSFDNDFFNDLKDTLIEKKNSLLGIKKELEDTITSLREKNNKLTDIFDKTNREFNDLSFLLKSSKSQLDKLQLVIIKEDNSKKNIEFQNTIFNLEEKKKNSEENIIQCKDKDLIYKEMSKILGEDGVKSKIISGIINPINSFISENIKRMGMPYSVILDKTFNAEIKHLGELLDNDSISTGESRKINIIILVAYLKLVRTKHSINVLFLDEIFASLDYTSIDDILYLLKSFANDFNINIFVVHHAIMNQNIFDRIISIKKDIFSTIHEE